MKRKRIAWVMNLANIGVLSYLLLNNYSPLYGAATCSISALAILIADIPEALTLKEVYNDEI